jgi:outer membrane protein OmpA-like peptidoglycan-associated protein
MMKSTNMNCLLRVLTVFTVSVFIVANVSAQQKPLQLKYTPSADVKWSMFGLNRVHIQDFSITDQYVDTCNCGESREFFDRANVTVGVSVYNNLSKRWAMSGDLGVSYGTVKRNIPVASDNRASWFSTARMDMYYHLSDGRLQLQPYMFSGVHWSQRNGRSLISMPVGLGFRYMVFNDNGMITGQAGYGLGITNSIKNSVIYSWGLYVNMGRKKKTPAPAVDPASCCGTALVDTDCDGVIDAMDKCVTVPGPVSNDGCPITDRDRDGIVDANDKCPDVPGPVSNQGCPVADRDGDGLSDIFDKCPDQPGPVSNEGCPIQDRDKDGIADNTDRCPDQPGPVSNMGCPITDRDGDGVPDIVDRCPDMFGSSANNGCPGAAPAPGVAMKNISMDTVQYIIYFDFDKYALTQNSYSILTDAIDYLKRNDAYNVVLVGHTDLEGDVPYNVKLSQNRVTTTKNYLMSYGIQPERISTSFQGKSKPAIPTYEKSLAWKNRRVEIFLVKK